MSLLYLLFKVSAGVGCRGNVSASFKVLVGVLQKAAHPVLVDEVFAVLVDSALGLQKDLN